MSIYKRPNHSPYRWNSEMARWERLAYRADGSGLSSEWTPSEWLKGQDEATGRGSLILSKWVPS